MILQCRSPDDPRSFTCTSHCPGSLVAYKKWMCITEEECCQRQVGSLILLEDMVT